MLLSQFSDSAVPPVQGSVAASQPLRLEIADCLAYPEKIAHYPAALARLSADTPPQLLSGRAADWVAEGLQHMTTLTRDHLASVDHPGLFQRVFARHHRRRAQFAQSYLCLSKIVLALLKVQSSASSDVGVVQHALAEAQNRVALLREAIDAGLAYLQQHPEEGLSNELIDTHPRDRFSRRLSQLELLHANQMLATQQLRLTTDRILDSYERVKEFLDIAYPTWLQQVQPAINQIGELHE